MWKLDAGLFSSLELGRLGCGFEGGRDPVEATRPNVSHIGK